MNTKIGYCLLLVLAYNFAYSQKLEVFDAFDKALSFAKENDKMVLVLVEPNDIVNLKVNTLKRLSSRQLAPLFSKYSIFHCQKMIGQCDTIIAKYNLPARLPLFLFLSSSGEIVNYSHGFSEEDSFYTRIHLSVSDDATPKKNFRFYAVNYWARRNDPEFMREYIEYMSADNRILADSVLREYMEAIDFENHRTLENRAYVYSKGPLFDGDIYRSLKNAKGDFEDIYNALPVSERGRVNTKIIYKSLGHAISRTDTAYALLVSRFAERTWIDKRKGYLSFLQNMKRFYGGVKDTLQFLKKNEEVVDQFFLPSLRDSMESEAIKEQRARELNDCAFTVYLWTRDTVALRKALNWSVASLEIKESPEKADTKAHLLYRLGNRSEAIIMQQRAIDLVKGTAGTDHTYKRELQKMKDNTL